MKKVLVLFLVALLVVSTSAMARTITLTPDKDSGLYGVAASGNSNRGDGGRFEIGASNGALVQFDLSGVLLAGEQIDSASIEIFAARTTYKPAWDNVAVGYSVLAPWQEGIGNGGTTGDLSFPWGPASIGDAVWNYQTVTAVVPDASFGQIASDGVAWAVPGGRGIGSDLGVKMIEEALAWTGSGSPIFVTGESLGVMNLTPDGLTVLNGWADGTMDNNGMNLWLTQEVGTGFEVASSEHLEASAPVLTLNITPEPATLALLAFGGLAAIRRRK